MGDVLTADGWQVTVDTITLDATEAVAAANEFNPQPGAGEQYALVDVTVTRTGKAQSGLDLGVDLMVDGTSVAPAPAQAPTQLHLLDEFAPGQAVRGQLAYVVPTAADDAQVRVAIGRHGVFLVRAK